MISYLYRFDDELGSGGSTQSNPVALLRESGREKESHLEREKEKDDVLLMFYFTTQLFNRLRKRARSLFEQILASSDQLECDIQILYSNTPLLKTSPR